MDRRVRFGSGRPVENQIGMQGRFIYDLQWTPDARAAPGESPEFAGGSIFTAVQERLGLKLETRKGSVATVVIERAEKPSEN